MLCSFRSQTFTCQGQLRDSTDEHYLKIAGMAAYRRRSGSTIVLFKLYNSVSTKLVLKLLIVLAVRSARSVHNGYTSLGNLAAAIHVVQVVQSTRAHNLFGATCRSNFYSLH